MVIKWTTQEKKDKFLEMYNLSQLNQGETENMNRLIIRNDIKSVIKKSSTNKSPESDSLTCEFYQTFREEPTPVFSKLFKKPGEERMLLNSFYEASITPKSKPDKDITKEN